MPARDAVSLHAGKLLERDVIGAHMQKFDFHTHSYCSDGTKAPAEVARAAKQNGLAAFALTDHDTLAGLAEAEAEAKTLGIKFVPGLEFDIKADFTLHILGLGVDRENAALKQLVSMAEERRKRRNEEMLKRLFDAGYDIYFSREGVKGVYSRLHMALALVERGYARDKTDAFRRFLSAGGIGYVTFGGTPRAAAIASIHAAGGVAVLAHPMKLKCDVHSLTDELVKLGLDGIEAFYPGTSERERALYLSLCAQYGLFATTGSDFHGENRPDAALGCAWEEDKALERAWERLVR